MNEAHLPEGTLLLRVPLRLDRSLRHPDSVTGFETEADDVDLVGAGADGAVALHDLFATVELVFLQRPRFHDHEDEVRGQAFRGVLYRLRRAVLGFFIAAVDQDWRRLLSREVADERDWSQRFAVLQKITCLADQRQDGVEVGLRDCRHF